MKRKPVVTSNIIRFLEAIDALENRSIDSEGMGLLYGNTGEGKTTSVAYLCNLRNGIHIRARSTWSVGSMLRAIVEELGLTPTYFNDPKVVQSINMLRTERNPLFIDEADYLLEKPKTLDVLRDLYDETKVPVILIGSEDLARRLKSNNRYDKHRRRISQWIRFSGITLEDAKKTVYELAEIEIGDNVVERLHTESQGNIAAFVQGVRMLERFAKANDLSVVTVSEWKNRPFPTPSSAGYSLTSV